MHHARIFLLAPTVLAVLAVTASPVAATPVVSDTINVGDSPTGVAFTPDEEIGHGAALLDIEGFGCKYAYTVDGGEIGGIECENFNAAAADITVHGAIMGQLRI